MTFFVIAFLAALAGFAGFGLYWLADKLYKVWASRGMNRM